MMEMNKKSADIPFEIFRYIPMLFGNLLTLFLVSFGDIE